MARKRSSEEIAAEKLHDLKALYDLPGGKVLVEALLKDTLAGIDALATQCQHLSLQEMISIAVSVRERLALIRSITRAELHEQLLREEILKNPSYDEDDDTP